MVRTGLYNKDDPWKENEIQPGSNDTKKETLLDNELLTQRDPTSWKRSCCSIIILAPHTIMSTLSSS